jgi:hypothetical protein
LQAPGSVRWVTQLFVPSTLLHFAQQPRVCRGPSLPWPQCQLAAFAANAEFRQLGPNSYSNRRQPCQNGPSLRDQGLVSFGDVTCQSFALTSDHLFLHDPFLHLLHQALEAEQRHAECARPLLPKVVPLRTHACARFRTCARFRNDVQASFSVQITLAACIGLLGREGGPYKRRVVFACGPFL